MKGTKSFIALLSCILFVMNFSCRETGDEPSLNDLQVIGSHNSYKIEIEKPLWDHLFKMDSAMALALEYGHISIAGQLDLGLRNLELDVYHDPAGAYYSNPRGLEILKSMEVDPIPFDQEQKLNLPGLKVFHIQDIDFRSHHVLFTDCLKEMKAWSEKNPGHTPVFVLINAKDEVIDQLKVPLPFSETALDSIDIEIRNVFSQDDLITPDLVRGNHQTLENAILTDGWPKLRDLKGRFLFVLDETEEKILLYCKDHVSLQGRVLFVNLPEGNPEAAFRIINDPVKDFDYIRDLSARGYMVRTRADANTLEARENNYERFEKALESGANVISTDYYMSSNLFNSAYQVSFDQNRYERIKPESGTGKN